VKLLLAILAALLAAALYLEWYVAPLEPPVATPAPAPGNPVGATAGAIAGSFVLPLADSDAYEVIAQRPLFSDSRRPPEPEAEQSAPQPEVATEDVEGLDLNAVIITTEETVALVRDAKSGDLLRVQAGEEVRGWKVETIDSGSILLKLGDRTATIELREFAPPAPAAEPPKPLTLQEQRRQRALRLRAQRQSLQQQTTRKN
jgi:hypothetical protein